MYNISINLKKVSLFFIVLFGVFIVFSSFANQVYAGDAVCKDPKDPTEFLTGTWVRTGEVMGYCGIDGRLPWVGSPINDYVGAPYSSPQYSYGPETCGINGYGVCPTSTWGCWQDRTFYEANKDVYCDDSGEVINTRVTYCNEKSDIVGRCDDINRGCYDTSIPGANFSLCPNDYDYYASWLGVTCTKDFYNCDVRDYGGDIGKIGYCLSNDVCPVPPPPPPPPGSPNFSVSLSPGLQVDTKGDAVSYTTYTVTLTALDGFSSDVTLTSPNCPSGATCSFDGGSTVTVSGTPETKILRITGLDSVNVNTYTITARGVGGGITQDGTASLQVNSSSGPGTCDTNAIGTNQFVSCVWDYPGGDANLIGLYGIDPSYTLKGAGPTTVAQNPADSYSIDYPPDTISGWTGAWNGPAGESDTFLVRWRGNFNFTGGKYTFDFPDDVSIDDGVQVIIEDPVFGNRTIFSRINNCYGTCDPTSVSSIDISAGVRTITVILKEDAGDARIKLNWSKEVVISGSCSASEGLINLHRWDGVSGNSVSDLTSIGAYPDSPTVATTRSSFEAPTNIGMDDYGNRMFGYLEVPGDGDYTFYIASDDNSALYLSTDSDPANKVLIASVGNWTDSRQWTKYPSQKSVPKTLAAGQKYFIEAIQKEGAGGDNLAVGWTYGGSGATQVIPGTCLSTTNIPPPPTNPSYSCNPAGDAVNLTWNLPTGYDTSYQRMRTPDASGTDYAFDDNYVGLSRVVSVVPNTPYTWWMHTKDTSNGDFSTAVGADFTCSPDTPDNPTNVTTSDAVCEEIRVSWNTAIGADSYNIYRNTSNSAPANPYTSNVTSIPWYNTNVAVGTSYYYWVESYSDTGGAGSTKVAANTNSTGGVSPVACAPNTFSLRVIKSGQGTVTSVPSGIACGTGCNNDFNDFDENTVVVLTATPATGRIFTGWSGACSGTGQCSVLVDAPKTIYANFVIDPNYREF